MNSIQHEHTLTTRVRAALKIATERLSEIEYTPSTPGQIIMGSALEDEAKRLRAIIHELLEALALV